MGGTQSSVRASDSSKGRSKPALRRLYSVDLESSFILIGNQKVDSLQYDPSQTFMVAYGIDKQIDPRFSKKTLSSVTVLDAHQVCMALIDQNVLPKDNVRLFAASKDLDMCTIEGIKDSFQAAAKMTGKNGILFFHFSGHGIKVGNEWGLAPADFDYSRSTFLSGDMLNSWLNEVDCQSLYAVISLDCCYAGGFANELIACDLNLRSGTYVLSACTAFETSLVIGPLGHSVYAYFLAYAIRVMSFASGTIPIHKIFEECSILCRSLTSFLVCYSSDFGLSIKAMQPVLKYFDVNSLPSNRLLDSISPGLPKEDVTASLLSVDRYTFVTQYFTRMNFQIGELCSLCLDWLGSMTEDGKCLKEIASRGLLQDEILNAVICLMMWSFASIQFVDDRENVHKASNFLLAFLYTATALDSLYHVRLTHDHMEQSLEFYLGVVEENKVDVSELQQLRKEVNREQRNSPNIEIDDTLNVPETSMRADAMESIKVCQFFLAYEFSLLSLCSLPSSQEMACLTPVLFINRK